MQVLKLISCVALSLAATAASGQVYDPATGGSPLRLLNVPTDGLGYGDMKAHARLLSDAKKWSEAEGLWAKLAADYPRDPENWDRLADAREALSKYREAIEPRSKAGALVGWYPDGYLMAIDQLQSGDRAGALRTLRWMVFSQHGMARTELYDWPELAALKSDPQFLEIVGKPNTKGWSRDQGWIYDIDFLRAEVKRVNPDYRETPLPAEFDRRYRTLKANVHALSDDEVYFGMLRVLATLNQGHVSLGGYPNERYLPIRLYAFPEGIFIVGASPEHHDLVGQRMVTIGALPAEEALRREAEAQSVDGRMQYLWGGVPRLTQTSYLHGMGAISSTKSVKLTLEALDGTRRAINLASTTTAPPQTQEDRPDKLIAPPNVPPPLFLSRIREVHWETYLPDHDALYVQVNNILADKDETLEDFGNRLLTVIGKTRPPNLILDLRHNNGGTTQTYPNLLRTLISYSRDEHHHLFVLMGRRTYSASANFITDLERLADPTFVGEASSECCNLHGDPEQIVLPYSGIHGELTAVNWMLSYPFDRRKEISPEVPIQLTARDYFAGRDPVLESVFKTIDSRSGR